jgi:hypothetical protein
MAMEVAERLSGEERIEVLIEAATAARGIRDAESRARTCMEVAECLSGEERIEVQREAVTAARDIRDAGDRARQISHMLPKLTGELLLDACREGIAAALADHHSSGWQLQYFAPHLPSVMIAEALAAAQGLGERQMAQFLGGLGSRLPDSVATTLLRALRRMSDRVYRSEAGAAVATRLPATFADEAVALARKISDPRWKSHALLQIALQLKTDGPPLLREALLREALAITHESSDPYYRAHAALDLIPHLEGTERADAIGKALAAVPELAREFFTAPFLRDLAQHLTGQQHTQCCRDALCAVSALHPPSSHEKDERMSIVEELAPHVPVDVLHEAVASAREAKCHVTCCLTLAHLAPRLGTPSAYEEALQHAIGTTHEARALAICFLAPHLRGDLIGEAATIACRMDDVRSSFERGPQAMFTQAVLRSREVMLSALSEPWSQWARESTGAAGFFQQWLHDSASDRREGLVPDLTNLSPVIDVLGGADAFAELADAVRDVADWWP